MLLAMDCSYIKKNYTHYVQFTLTVNSETFTKNNIFQ